MDKKCANCSFYMRYDGKLSQFAKVFSDNIIDRCGKESRTLKGGFPPPIHNPDKEFCKYFYPFNTERKRWEWDKNKNISNRKKHFISFKEAINAMENDPYCCRQPVGNPNKWDKIPDIREFAEKGIQKTTANLDPLRDEYLFKIDDKLFILVSTLRGELGLLKQRVISARRTKDESHIKFYVNAPQSPYLRLT